MAWKWQRSKIFLTSSSAGGQTCDHVTAAAGTPPALLDPLQLSNCFLLSISTFFFMPFIFCSFLFSYLNFKYFWICLRVLLSSSLFLFLSVFVSCFTLFCVCSLALTSHLYLFVSSLFIRRFLQPSILLLFPDVLVFRPTTIVYTMNREQLFIHSDVIVII